MKPILKGLFAIALIVPLAGCFGARTESYYGPPGVGVGISAGVGPYYGGGGYYHHRNHWRHW